MNRLLSGLKAALKRRHRPQGNQILERAAAHARMEEAAYLPEGTVRVINRTERWLSVSAQLTDSLSEANVVPPMSILTFYTDQPGSYGTRLKGAGS